MGFALEFGVCLISSEPFEHFSLNFTQILILVETMGRTHDSAMETQCQGHSVR